MTLCLDMKDFQIPTLWSFNIIFKTSVEHELQYILPLLINILHTTQLVLQSGGYHKNPTLVVHNPQV